MLKNYFKIAIRSLKKEKLYTLINILGLSIGLASCLLIYVYVSNELSFDRFHNGADRIYRIGHEVSLGTGTKIIASTSHRLAPTLETDFPELEQVVHFSRIYAGEVTFGKKKFREERIAFADSSFFEFFDFPLLQGNPETATLHPNTVVITDQIAQKYFGKADPIGQTIRIEEAYGPDDMELTVSGVIAEMPNNSHFHIDFLVSMATGTTHFPPIIYRAWGWDSQYTYVKLAEGTDPQSFISRLDDFGKKHIEGKWFKRFFAQPMTDIHLHSHLNSEIEANGDINNIYIFSFVAIIILVLAVVNYMNLATAKSINRSKEVGVRKVVGAARTKIIAQLLSESLIFTFMALFIGGFIAEISASWFNELSNNAIQIGILKDLELLSIYVSLGILVGILSGSYPAFYLSSFKPAAILKMNYKSREKGVLWLRKGLVVFQFALSIALIAGTVVANQQLRFLRNKKLGISTDNTIMVQSSSAIRNQYESFRNELLTHQSVVSSAISNRRVGRDINSGNFFGVEKDGELVDARLSMVIVGFDFLKQYEANLLAGRQFSRDIMADTAGAFILNQSALKALDIESAQGVVSKTLKAVDFELEGPIVGVVEDLHFETIHNKIKPMVFILGPESIGWISVKVKGDDLKAGLAHIEKTWNKFDNRRDFRYSFLDEDLHQLYIAEERFLNIFSLFSIMAIGIACLGIFGLVTFTISQRAKEIGIRKVHGASTVDISTLLTSNFLKLVMIANLFAWPIAYWAMNGWLKNFEYKTNMDWWVFLLSGMVALVVALVPSGIQSVKAALANPIKALKEE
ncbi:MAG: ABC transporter permease [Bacteroidota bacterium]